MRDINEIQNNNAQMVLMSAARPDNSTVQIEDRHAALKSLVNNQLGLKSADVVGCFEGEKEPSLAIILNDPSDLPRLAILASEFGQHSILILGEHGATLRDGRDARELVIEDYMNGAGAAGNYIGIFRAVSEQEAHNHQGWSYVPVMNQYFTVV